MDPQKQLGTLRVEELKALCKEHGVKATGRKSELVERLVETVGTKNGGLAAPPLPAAAAAEVVPSPARSAKGRPRGRQRAAAQSQPEPQATKGASPSTSSACGSAESAGRGRSRSRGGVGRGGRSTGGSFKSKARAEWLETCDRCKARCDMHQLKYTARPPTLVCPLCCINLMDPFNEVADVLKYLIVASGNVDFEVDMQVVPQPTRGEAVYVRMVKLGTSKVSQEYPHMMDCLINNVKVFTVQQPEVGHKRRDVPIEVTSWLRPGKNKVHLVVVNPELGSGYGVSLVHTRARDLNALTRLVLPCSHERAKARVVSLMQKQQDLTSAADDEDIRCISSHKLPLRCPVSMDRIQVPVRGHDCSHIQCFDLEAYLTSNQQMRAFNNRWVCPICSLVLRPDDLCKDAYVEQVLAKTSADLDEVTLNADGSWGTTDPSASTEEPQDELDHDVSFAEDGVALDLDIDSEESENRPLSMLCSGAATPPKQVHTPSDATLSPLHISNGAHGSVSERDSPPHPGEPPDQKAGSLPTLVVELDDSD